MAEDIGTTVATLSSAMNYMKRKGRFEYVDRRCKDVGTTRVKTQKGIKYLERKEDSRWKRVGRIEGQIYKTREKKKKLLITSAIKTTLNMPKPRPFKVEEKEPNLIVKVVKNPNDYKMVKVNPRTWLQVKKEKPDESVQQWFKEHYETE